MQQKGSSPIDNIKLIFDKYVTRFDINLFFCTFVFTLLNHLYMFTNITINHDNVDGLFSDCAFGLSSGRWLLHLITVITGDFGSPWFDGILGAIFLSLAAVLIIRFLKIQKYLPALLAAFALVAFPTVASTYSYMFNASQYLFALFIATVGVYLIRKDKLISMIIGSLLITLSMGCYQSYFCLAALLLVIAVITDALTNKYEKSYQLVLAALKYVGFLALSMIMYFVILKVLLAVTGTELVAYSGMNAMGISSIGELGKRIIDSYINFGAYYIDAKDIYNVIFPILSISSLLISLGVVVFLTIKNKIYKKPLSLLVIFAIIVIFPFATFLAYLMADKWSVHQVMFYPAVIPLILPCLYLDKITFSGKKIKDWFITGISALLIALQVLLAYEFAFVTNRAYFYMGMTYENVHAFYTKLTAKIEMTEGYTKETPVALMGGASAGIAVPPTNMTGVYTGDDGLNIYSRTTFLQYYVASELSYPSDADWEKIRNSGEYEKMPCYPADGSIKNVEGIIIVKLS